MKTTALSLVLLAFFATSSFAQSSQFQILLGGSKRLISDKDNANGLGVSNNWKFGDSVKEVAFVTEVDPGTMFKIKVGQIIGPAAFRLPVTPTGGTAPVDQRVDVNKATIDHVDALIDYRFSEPFGSTGIFAGVGLYRAHGTADTTVNTIDHSASETNYGFSGGVNADLPMTRSLGFIAEATYHWVNYHYRPRYVTVAAGVRFSF